jgi:oligosaccharide repeat unit polymerase
MWKEFSEHSSRPTAVTHKLILLHIPLLALVFGMVVLSGAIWAVSVYFALAYLALFIALLNANRLWHDWLNPLSLIVFMGFIRFSIPGFLSSLNIESDLQIFQIMGLEKGDWILGHALALIGLFGVVIGWLLRFPLLEAMLRRIQIPNVPYSGGIPYAAIFAMLVGSIALFTFVGSHGAIGEAVYTGNIRQTEIQTGTGKYFYLSLMLIAGSVVFSAYLNKKNYLWWITLLPNAVAASCFFVLGGRVRAFAPIAAGGLLLWYRRDELKVSLRTVAVIAVLLPVFSYIGQIYRGGHGVEGVKETFSMSSLAEYVQYAVWIEWGQLHALAGAVAIGPGVLQGQTFANMLWPLSKFLDLPSRSAGVFIVETLVGLRQPKWSFHATLIGDTYLNFGLIGVLVVMIVFGAILKKLYIQMTQGRINSAIYVLTIVYSMRIFFETIEKFSEMLLVLFFAFLVIQAGQILNVAHRE